MQKLRIAMTVTGHFTSPQPLNIVYAPIDLAIQLCAGLTKRGHEVTYYAPEGSVLPDGITVETKNLQPLAQKRLDIFDDPVIHQEDEGQKIKNLWDQYLIAHMYEAAASGKHDLLHIHPVDRALPLAFSHNKTLTVYTLHDPIHPWRAEVFKMFQSSNQWYVSISNTQRKGAPDLPYAATIYNGLDIKTTSFSAEQGKFLLFVGRLWPKKGADIAIKVAQACKMKLMILGPVGPQDYYDKQIKPFLDRDIVHVGVLARQDTYNYYRQASALLFPIQWEEPFGLVMTEAMACGTPVIAFRRGSVPEVIKHNETGYIVDTFDEMVRAVAKIDQIDRAACRRHVEGNFSIEKMVDDYEQAYYSILERQAKK